MKKAPARATTSKNAPVVKAVVKHAKTRKQCAQELGFDPFGDDDETAQAHVQACADEALAAPITAPMAGLPAGPASAIDRSAGLRLAARSLFWSGWRLTHIAKHLDIPRTTLYGWHKSEKWDSATPFERVGGALETRLITLINKDQKTGGDFKEIDLLHRQMVHQARIEKYNRTGKDGDLNPNLANRNAGPKKKPEKNEFSPEEVEKLRIAFLDGCFDYQRLWWENVNRRTRAILKSRQIGATYYFAREAFIDALLTGRNQIFLSASRAQAYLFRNYIIAFAKEVTGITLQGDPLKLANGAELYFLGTNSKTAQGYHGNLYFDEFFWTNNFKELNDVAAGMASHKKWHITYSSTPSSIQHPAYALWSGKHLAERKLEIDISHAMLAGGHLGADGIWRNIITVEDAERGGCTLFDIADLRLRNAADVFSNLYMCHFTDDAQAVFGLQLLQRCMVDSWDAWRKDFKPFAERPFGHKRVWVGYDPSHTGDKAALVVLAPPEKPGGKFRLIYRLQLHGLDFEAQAAAIKKVCETYNVEKMTIDATGLGNGVYQLVRKFFPQAIALHYTLERKTLLVLKAQAVMRAGRLEFDSGDKDMAAAFMSVKKELTASGKSITYTSGRSTETGHGDLAWATMHALSHEPLEEGTGLATIKTKSFMEFSE